jgi:SAM-dependent methyltransferase
MKPYAESCEQNREPVLNVLKQEIAGRRRLLEIGSGTGQHAVYLAGEFPDLVWQTSEVSAMHEGIHAWLEEDTAPPNVLPPLNLDVCNDSWPEAGSYDAVFSANTVHIISWPQVQCLFSGVGKVLEAGGVFCLYGPFNYNGHYTSESHARFDVWLKQRDPLSGIRDFGALNELAGEAGLELKKDYEMPANNRILTWLKAR